MSFTKHIEFEEPEASFVVKLPCFGIGRLSVFPDMRWRCWDCTVPCLYVKWSGVLVDVGSDQ